MNTNPTPRNTRSTREMLEDLHHLMLAVLPPWRAWAIEHKVQLYLSEFSDELSAYVIHADYSWTDAAWRRRNAHPEFIVVAHPTWMRNVMGLFLEAERPTPQEVAEYVAWEKRGK